MLKSSILVSLISLLVSAFAFLNQVALAKVFGTNASMDVYLLATSIPMFVFGVLSVGISYSLVPELLKHRHDPILYRRFCGLLLIGIFLLSLLIFLLGFLTTSLQIELFGSDFPEDVKTYIVNIGKISWIAACSLPIIAYFRGMQNANERFLLATLSSALPIIFTIFSCLFFGPKYGLQAVVWGAVIGSLLLVPIMLLHVLSDLDLTIQCFTLWKSVSLYLVKIPIIVLAMLCFTIFQTIDSFWALKIGSGNLSYLGYCQRLLIAIGNLVVAGPVAVILPRLAKANIEGRKEDLINDSITSVRMVVAVAAPIAITISLLSKSLVKVFFERGAFDQNSTIGVSNLLPMMMVGMVSMLCVAMLFRALFAKNDILYVSILGILTTFIYFALSGIFSSLMGVEGIAISYAMTWGVMLCLTLFTLCRSNFNLLLNQRNYIFLLKIIALIICTTFVIMTLKSLIMQSNASVPVILFECSVITIISTLAYVYTAIRIFHLQEISLIFDFFTSKARSLNIYKVL
jgi:putative peptidoglycan lipid II flippase